MRGNNLKAGDLVKIDLKYLMFTLMFTTYNGIVPDWYTSDSFEIIKICFGPGGEIAYLDRSINMSENKICLDFLMIDIIGQRKMQRKLKLEKLGCTSLIITEE